MASTKSFDEVLIEVEKKLEECFTRQIKVVECFTQLHQEFSLWCDKLSKSVEAAEKEKKSKLIQAAVKEKKNHERQSIHMGYNKIDVIKEEWRQSCFGRSLWLHRSQLKNCGSRLKD
ncbi:hypothetical protein Tco_1364309 [Tanacetum coccineum]